MGGAWVWLEYLSFFASRGIPCYAVSLRGHGASYYPSFLRMVYATTKRMLADDVVAAVRWVEGHQRGLKRGLLQGENQGENQGGQQEQREGEGEGGEGKGEDGKGEEAVLVGHSGDGGLAQMVLSEREVRARVLVLLASVRGFGADEQPFANVEAFQDRASPYESLVSGMEMIKPFIDAQKVLGQITSYHRPGSQGILVLCGEVDKIMKPPMMEDLADTYRANYSAMVREKKLEGDDPDVEPALGEGGRDNSGHGVRFNVVAGAGHYLLLDVTWIVGAQKLLAFYEQL